MIAMGDAEQSVAVIDDVNARRRAGGGNGPARGRRQCRCRQSRRNRCGLARNDQLLARRQNARSLVAIGLQDRRGRNIIAARQAFERVAGADDDRGTAMSRRMGGRDRTRRNAAGGLKLRMGRRRIGGEPAPSSGHAGAGGRIRLRRGDRRRQGLRLILRLRAGILRQFAALDRGSRHRAGGFRLRRKGIGEGILREARRHVGAAAGKPKRHQRQHRALRDAARAKQLDDTGHGYSLVRNKLLF